MDLETLNWHQSFWVLFCFVYLKSGIGSCIAPKAGFAHHPAKGKCGAVHQSFKLWWKLAAVLDPGAVRATWLLYPPAKMRRVQATLY